jgi:hypothetical protein
VAVSEARLVPLGEAMANQITLPNRRKSALFPFVLLDRNKTRSYKLGIMMRWTRVALALLAAFTIAYILITPDPTDDVDGILQQNHLASANRMLAVSLWEFQTPVSALLHLFTFTDRGQHLATFELLDVISVCRC